MRAPCLLLTFALAASASDWTQWRGPARDGQAPDLVAPDEWPDQLTEVWKVDGVGAGYAGPLVSGDHIWLHSRLGDAEVVSKRRLSDGGVVWERRYPAPYEPVGVAKPHGLGPKSTPILADGRLFTLGISGILSAFDAESGEELWRKDFRNEFSKTWPIYGVAMSPAVVHGKLIAHVGADDDGALIAFRPEDGSEAWRWEGDGPSYSSPMLFTPAGREMLVSQSSERSIALDPETGELLWELPFTTPYTQNIMTPTLFEDLILFSGTRSKTVAVRVNDSRPEEVWETTDATMYMSSPVVDRGVVYGFTEKQSGNVFAMDPSSGEVLWRGPGRLGHNATLMAVDGYLLTLTSDAELIVTKLGADSYEVLESYTISDSETYGHPAAVGERRLLIKDDRALTLWSW